MSIVILGAGFSGRAIAGEFLAEGMPVYGTTRSAQKAEGLAEQGITPLIFDGESVNEPLVKALKEARYLVQSIAPGADGDPFMRLFGSDLKVVCPHLTWAAYLSTVGVYGDHQGQWVDEDTPCKPVSIRSQERVEAENLWMEAGRAAHIPISILRLSGIYGPGRNGFVNLANGTARRLVKKDQVFNRIRVEDIASASLFLAKRLEGGIFNITDHEPAPPQDVVAEAARLMGVEAPPEMAFEQAELSPMARSFYGENKRVSNAKICNLGFKYQYPDYRVSLADLWQNQNWS